MTLNIDTLKRTQAALGHKWFTDRPNIIGVRSTLDVPDVFNDILCIVHSVNGVEFLKCFPITTDPGVHYQINLLNPKGCAVMKPGQYIDAYKIGTHVKPDHRALVQHRPITVYRDADKDGKAEATAVEETGLFGVNIHGANRNVVTAKIGPWSAGCQVFSTWAHKEELINICEAYRGITNNNFTYTLITEKDLRP